MSKLITICTYYDISEAHIARGLLEHNGIAAFLFDINLASVQWTYLTAISGIRLMVIETEAGEAATLLSNKDESIFEEGVDNCPSCKSGNIFRPSSWLLGFLILIFSSQIFLARSHRRICRQCGHKWKLLS